MRLRSTVPFVAVLLVLSAFSPGGWSLTSAAGSAELVLSQVYGGGGNTGAPYSNKFVELFNRGTAPASLGGYSIQYASATGTGNFSTNVLALPSATVEPGGYFLVQLAGGANGAPLPSPDAIGTINPAATAGKVILASTAAGLTCNGGSTPCTSGQLATIVDLVGYGSSNFYEGSGAAPALSATTAAVRAAGGCTDTDENAVDFFAGAPTPRNSSAATNPCAEAEPTPTALVTAEPSSDPTYEPTPVITSDPSVEPTLEATPTASAQPTEEVTPEPTPELTSEPTPDQTAEPTPDVTPEPTPDPTSEPTPQASTGPAFEFDGFYAPVIGAPIVNVVKAGSAVPIKFTLGGDFGLGIADSGSPSSFRHSCTSAEEIGLPETTSTAGTSTWMYDAYSNTYSYVWKTSKAWSGTCRTFVLSLVDGSSHEAEFAFR